MNRFIFLVLVVVGFGSCIELQKGASNPEGSIVVVGNGGTQAKSEETRVLVVDTQSGTNSIQTFIPGNSKDPKAKQWVPIQDALGLKAKPLVQDEKAPPLKLAKTSNAGVRLDWITSKQDEKGSAVLKLSGGPLLDPTDAKKMAEPCSLFETNEKGLACVRESDLSISPHFEPVFKKDEMFFIGANDQMMLSIGTQASLPLSADQSLDKTLAKTGTKEFFFDAAGALFYRTAKGEVYFLSKEQLDSLHHLNSAASKLVSADDILFKGEDGSVYIYLLSGKSGLTEGLQLSSFYKFDSSRQQFEKLWTIPKSIHFSEPSFEPETSVVDASTLYFLASAQASGTTDRVVKANGEIGIVEANIGKTDVNAGVDSEKTLFSLNQNGLLELPLMKTPDFVPDRVMVGKAGVFVTSKNPKTIGQACFLNPPKSPQAVFSCRILSVPQGKNVMATVLSDQALMVAFSSQTKAASERSLSEDGKTAAVAESNKSNASVLETYEIVTYEMRTSAEQTHLQETSTTKIDAPVKQLRLLNLAAIKSDLAVRTDSPGSPSL